MAEWLNYLLHIAKQDFMPGLFSGKDYFNQSSYKWLQIQQSKATTYNYNVQLLCYISLTSEVASVLN